MSTPAIISVEGFKVAELYKHSDGDPESTLEWLSSFNRRFSSGQSNSNKSYKFAQLVRSSVIDAEKYNLQRDNDLGWGVEPAGEAWGQWLYVLKKDGTVVYDKLDE